MAATKYPDKTAVVVGGGFAGIACAKELAKRDIAVTLLDKHNYHQFQPLLYQVASGMLGSHDVARPLRGIFRKTKTVFVKEAEVAKIDPVARSATATDGSTWTGDYLVLAMGAVPNFFNTEGAAENSFPLYSLEDAQRLRSRVFQVAEDADMHPERVAKGALNLVVIGGGPTGVETAGALADLVNDVFPSRFHDLAMDAAQVYLIDAGHNLLAAFSDEAHAYTAKMLNKKRVKLEMGVKVAKITPDRVVLSDGREILTHTVVWGGGLKAAAIAGECGIPQGPGGRFDVEHDLSVDGFPGVYAAGDVANILGSDDVPLPQLGSVAMQAGKSVGESILAELDGKPRPPFRYHDKGIMAMIGRRAAIAEFGKHHHELHGPIAVSSWLGVHAYLMSGSRERIDAFVSWAWDYFAKSRATSVIDRPDAAQIDWGDDDDDDDDDDVG